MSLVENQLEKRTTPYVLPFLHYAWAILFTTEAQSTGAPFHSKHTAQPTAPLSLPAGPASTAVIILRTAQVEADGRETPPPRFLLWNHSPCLKSTISFPCPSLNCSDSAPAASAATPPCSNRLLHYSASLPSAQHGQGRSAAGPAGLLIHPACWQSSTALMEEARNLPALLQKPGTEKGEQGIRGF